MITTSTLPLIMPIVGYMLTKLRKNKPPPIITKHYPIEQKYAIYLNTICTCFYYGIFTPLLFFFGALSFTF